MKNGPNGELAEKKLLLKYVTQNLEATYGIPLNDRPDDPLDELILTILSQSTSDLNSSRAFASLKSRFPDWESVRRARTSSIAAAIKSGGLANTKSVVIKHVLNQILERSGRLDLSFLHTTPLEEATEFLLSLKGVGPKTAACVLLFSCKRPIFPMDTHILRITRRLGILPRNSNDLSSHKLMHSLIPHQKHYSLHINLLRHGRKICRPRNPLCDQCSLQEQCQFSQVKI
ncbi:MAG: endonuclease III [Blastocatellia bacterium]|nr:endonuclease III [Blastocatellia bacterium]